MIKTYFLVLLIFSNLAVGANQAISALKNSNSKGYSRADRVRDFKFPEDHGAHRDFQTEWWYATGNLQDSSGAEFGYQLTIFRNNIDPNFLAGNSGLKTNQIYMGHLAISDIKNKEFYSYEIFRGLECYPT